MLLWFLLPAVLIVSLLLSWVLRHYALSNGLMDVPNARSSHSVPTPRGGGLAIVLTYLAVLPVLGYQGWLDWLFVIGLLGAGFSVSLVGFLDDHGHIAAGWRLLAHFLAAIWFLAWLPELPRLTLMGASFDLGITGYTLATLMLVWLLNLYNFMDGIDGIAGIEAITVSFGGGGLFWLIDQPVLAIAPLLLAAAVAGFLVWNFPPAKIFMGDVGSGFLGITLGALMLQAASVAPELLWAWLILLGVFVSDATFTLLRRLLRGDKIYEAHRSHAYQYASRECEAHLPVTLTVLAINVLWLWPWSCMVALGFVPGWLALLIAYSLLVALAVRFHAGQSEMAHE